MGENILKRKLSIILICVLFILNIFSATISIGVFIRRNIDNISNNPLDGGWIEERDGIKILHVSGSNYEMGYQQGYLLKNEIEQNYRAIFNLDNGEIYYYILDLWNDTIKNNIPKYYVDEIWGIANGSEKSVEDVVVFSIGFATFLFGMNCIEMSAWGPATNDGRLIHMRSYDIPLYCKDSVSGNFIQENQIVIVRKPDNGYLSLYASFAGDAFSKGGINEKGLAISCESSPCSDVTLNATWFSCRILKVLDNASTLDDAVDIMTSSRTGSSNYIISDGNIPSALVIEETANYSYVGTWDNEVESTPPFWEINNVVRRKNFYINPTLASTQRDFYNPRIYFFLDPIINDDCNWFTTWRFYKTLSLEIEDVWGNLDINNTMDMLRSIYLGKTDFILNFYLLLGLDPFYACRQWVAYPENGDIVISFADGINQAQYNQLHYFNLFELYDTIPP
jgi:hypothetical protein